MKVEFKHKLGDHEITCAIEYDPRVDAERKEADRIMQKAGLTHAAETSAKRQGA
ncbi:MAG TPA: hypothetical protein IAB67_06260 [Candidatus Ventrousia excrementavium]|uniref:Uncharacterized protein n=1 Tax=Candidatus Ventrousia excrementavium TaxID=2840961 RepID=A0A9D1IXA6_9CLOT|nr:hypothetical protein [Candidatus Ventrousia excrementavium]